MKLFSALLLACLAVCFRLKAQDETGSAAVNYPAGYTALENQTYVRVGDWEGKLDAYLPPKATAPFPVVIKIHGGGWTHGTRVSPGRIYFKMGFALVNVQYRFTQRAPAPAAIEDCRCALNFVIRHAAEWGIDVHRIVLQGGSAGGHLVLITGLLGNDRRFDRLCPQPVDMRVAAIVDEYGPTDFTAASWGVISRNKSVRMWLGAGVNDEAFKASVSPLTYVTPQSPPVIIFHGDHDHTVPIEQSDVLEARLKACGVKTAFVLVRGAGHGRFTPEQSEMEDRDIRDFLESLPAFRG